MSFVTTPCTVLDRLYGAPHHVGCHASRSMRPRICPKRRRVRWLSASCRMKYRACRIRRPPVLNDRCCRLVSDQLWMAWGSASRRRRLPRLYAMTPSSRRTSLARKRWQERRVQGVASLPYTPWPSSRCARASGPGRTTTSSGRGSRASRGPPGVGREVAEDHLRPVGPPGAV